jgi:hypothetical protein
MQRTAWPMVTPLPPLLLFSTVLFVVSALRDDLLGVRLLSAAGLEADRVVGAMTGTGLSRSTL